MTQLVTGVGDLPRGLAVLRAHPGLWKWVIAPAFVTLVVFASLIAGIVVLLDPVAGWVVAHMPDALARVIGSFAGSLLRAVIAVGLSLGALLVLASVAGMIAGPFNEILSEHIETKLTGKPPAAFSLVGFVTGAVLGILHGIRRLVVSLIGLVLAFALGLIPVVGPVIALVLGGWLAAQAAAYDSYDAVLARRSMRYREKMAYLARHRQRTLGLGAAVAGMLLVPGLNLVALGLGAAGATVAAHALEREQSRAI